MNAKEAAAQAADEIAERLWALHTLGVHDANPYADPLRSQITAVARTVAAQLAQHDDDRLSAQTCIDLMCALWPHAAPEDVGRADWWRTPLGRLCARSLGREDAETVTQHVAAAMLGVTRGTVSTMVTRGTLPQGPDGGVLRSAVLARIGR